MCHGGLDLAPPYTQNKENRYTLYVFGHCLQGRQNNLAELSSLNAYKFPLKEDPVQR